jgi:hypothetical protein
MFRSILVRFRPSNYGTGAAIFAARLAQCATLIAPYEISAPGHKPSRRPPDRRGSYTSVTGQSRRGEARRNDGTRRLIESRNTLKLPPRWTDRQS